MRSDWEAQREYPSQTLPFLTTTARQTRGATRSISTGIGMKKLAESSLHRAALLLVFLLVCGCKKGTYFTGDLAKDQLLGAWVVSSFPEGGQPPTPIENCILTLRKDGTFEATNFPLVVDYYPSLKLKHTTEQGTWSLEDKGGSSVRFRWKLALVFNQSRFGIEFDITEGSSGFELFERTDLDAWIGYTLRRQK